MAINCVSVTTSAESNTQQLPSGAGAWNSYASVLGMWAFLADTTSQNAYMNGFLQLVNAYLLQIFYLTAGYNTSSYSSGPALVSGSGQLSFPSTQIRRVMFDFTSAQRVKRIRGFNPQASYYGVMNFVYATGVGPLRYIDWQHSFFEPEAEGATAFNYYLANGVSGTASFNAQPLQLPGISLDGGAQINPDADVFSGFQAHGINLTGVYRGGFYTQQLTGMSGGTTLDNTKHLEILHLNDELVGVNDGPFWALMFSLLQEIWQMTVHPTAGTSNSGAIDCSTPGVYYPTQAIVKGGTLSVAATITDPNYNFGTTGLPMLGHWAPITGAYFGEIRFINSASSALTKLPRDCSAIWVSPKPFTTASINMVQSNSVVVDNGNNWGQVNLAGGITDGLAVPP